MHTQTLTKPYDLVSLGLYSPWSLFCALGPALVSRSTLVLSIQGGFLLQHVVYWGGHNPFLGLSGLFCAGEAAGCCSVLLLLLLSPCLSWPPGDHSGHSVSDHLSLCTTCIFTHLHSSHPECLLFVSHHSLHFHGVLCCVVLDHIHTFHPPASSFSFSHVTLHQMVLQSVCDSPMPY